MERKDTLSTNSTEITVRESKKGKYAQDIIIGAHHLSADEPAASGGNDLGPSPYEFLLAGLGACTSMTIRMYAESKNMPLKSISVKLNHYKSYAADCEHCEDKNSFLDRIEVHISLEGNLSEAQREKLLDIARKCPVHRTLTSKIDITTQLSDL